ncbi:cytochrome b/b6 domain-containing protein [Terricaulis silvestris]|uniref:histidine kinase n=1 Tax=Terricaulis silvestris TaxID=2686094 RepID=A0A6I6MGJ9_9CAUL|nr:cytochrome b/b6 domain-containing protein [Terricaulis silvestris]QGZ93419.1 Gliding motility regulatory protein [Terricaulis silvestris]
MAETQQRYTRARQILHWTLVALLIAQVCAIALFKNMSSLEAGAAVLAVHFGIGVLVLLVALGGVFAMSRAGGRPHGVGTPRQQMLARIAHVTMLVLVAALAAAGIATAWARGNAIPLGAFSLPPPFEASDELAETLLGAHRLLGFALGALVTVHLGAVVHHWRAHRLNVLKRMLPGEHPSLFRNLVPLWAQLSVAFAALLLVVVLVGFAAISSTGRMAAEGERAYDVSFLSLSHARAAQNGVKDLLLVEDGPGAPSVREALDNIASDLAIAIERAPDASSREHLEDVGARLDAMRARGLDRGELARIDAELEDEAMTLTGASFAARAHISAEAARLHDLLLILLAPAILLAGLAALIVGVNISRLVSRLRTMVRAIGTEEADSAISVSGQGEFAGLMREVLLSRDAFAAQRARAAVHILFDNAEEGFLTVDAGLTVGPQYSAACEGILGEPPAGRSIVELLCGTSPEAAEGIRATMESVFKGSSEFARDLKLELLPKEFERGGKFIRANYKFLTQTGALMLILTDASETTLLAREVERERRRLEMIVLGFTEGEAFAGLVNEYRRFLDVELSELIARVDEDAIRSEFARKLHTFKGLLAQFSFPLSPACIHEVETRLAANASLSAASASELLGLDGLEAVFEQDLASVSDLLGPGFDAPGGRVLVPQHQVRAMEQLARAALAGASGAASTPMNLLLRTLASLGTFNAKSALGLHSRGAPALAMRLGKELEPIFVEGDDVPLSPERYGPFLRSLVHVFRNAVDHGIETPDVRLGAGKQSAGSIRCVVHDGGDVLKIHVADDGGGIDRAVLVGKLIAKGENKTDVERLALSELVFREGLSSREAADHVSGRGVGLSAVKAEMDRIGGTIVVETELGLGTAFTFILPRESELHAKACDPSFESMAV